MVPLRSISELMGAQVSYRAETNEAAIRWDQNQLVFRKGQSSYDINGDTIQMDTEPDIVGDSFIVPLGVLLRGMGIPFEYRNHKVLLQDDAFNKSTVMQNVVEFDRGKSIVSDDNALDVGRFDLSFHADAKGNIKGQLTITADNQTPGDIPKGNEDLHEIIVFAKTMNMDADFPSVDISDRPRPAIKKGGSVTRSLSFDAYRDPLQYVLAAGRTIKSKEERE